MVDLSNWIESTSSSNFQSFDSKLQEIEAGVQQVDDKSHVHSYNQSIKSLESELRQKDGGHPRYPMKKDQLQDLFARAWSCKQFLQDIWEGVTQRTTREYEGLKSELEKIVTLKDKAQSRNDLENIKDQIKKFHAQRKKKLQERLLSPKQNYKLRREADTLWDEVSALVEVIAPKQFSFEWLSQAYLTNRQNQWVVFVDQVPPIDR